MKRTLTFAAALALGAAALMPLPSSAQTDLQVYIGSAPPAPRYEAIPAPRQGYVWAPGFWNYQDGRHTWIEGRWEAVRDGYQYQRAEWQRENDGWRLNRGGWQRVSDNGRGYDNRRDVDYIRVAPPPPRYERVPRARRGYVWVPGYWNWRGDRHVWIRGTWMRERSGYVYAQPSWVQRDGQWYMEHGRWERARGRDRDRDGVPDAYDRDRDNDGVRNRNDADRDGDGYRNDRDAYPDDRRRH